MSTKKKKAPKRNTKEAEKLLETIFASSRENFFLGIVFADALMRVVAHVLEHGQPEEKRLMRDILLSVVYRVDETTQQTQGENK